MKIIKELVGFVLGIAVGISLYSLLKLRPLSPVLLWNDLSATGTSLSGRSLRPIWVQRAFAPQVCVPRRLPSEKRVRLMRNTGAEQPTRLDSQPATVNMAQPTAANKPAVAKITTAPVPPKLFKSLGYVEKQDGELEAIILQENQIQVVHIRDLIAGRYRVTKVAPDSVEAVDEALAPSTMAKPSRASVDLIANAARQPSSAPSADALGQPEVLAGRHRNDSVANFQTVSLLSVMPALTAYTPPTAPLGGSETARIVPAENATPTANSIGYIEKADGKVEAVVADGDTVRLVLQTPAGTLAEAAPPQDSLEPAVPLHGSVIKPLGFVVQADGEFAAILSQGDEVYVVRKGDRFADRFRALSVSADAVEVEEEPPAWATPPPSASPSFPGLLSAKVEQEGYSFSKERLAEFRSDERGQEPASPTGEMSLPPGRIGRQGQDGHTTPRGTGILPVKDVGREGHSTTHAAQAQDAHATFVFQTLGYVETHDGEFQAIVADGSDVYVVKQGETFADQYRATSVDPVLVLAVKVLPGQHAGNLLSAQTDSGERAASKKGALEFPLFAWAKTPTLREVGVSDSPFLTDLGMNLLNSSLTGFDF